MSSPLADRIRPETLDDIVGQQHLLAPGRALRNIIESGNIPNLIFYGPSGIGKTTVARIIAQKTNKRLFRLNATTSGIADIKAYPFLNYSPGHRLKAVLMDAAILTVAYLDDVVVWRLSRSDRNPIDSDVKP